MSMSVYNPPGAKKRKERSGIGFDRADKRPDKWGRTSQSFNKGTMVVPGLSAARKSNWEQTKKRRLGKKRPKRKLPGRPVPGGSAAPKAPKARKRRIPSLKPRKSYYKPRPIPGGCSAGTRFVCRPSKYNTAKNRARAMFT